MKGKYLVVLDRDGVINVDHGHVHSTDKFEFIDGVFEFCKIAISRGAVIAVATNQAGIARGLYSVSEFENLTKWMVDAFMDKGVCISHVFHCPHHPDFPTNSETVCGCRKPLPGMLIEALSVSQVPGSRAVMIGNSDSDMLAGRAAKFAFCVKIGDISENSNLNFSSVNELLCWSKSEWFWEY